jgi:hypothetical protein
VNSNNELNRVEKESDIIRGSRAFTKNIQRSQNRQMLLAAVDHLLDASYRSITHNKSGKIPALLNRGTITNNIHNKGAADFVLGNISKK